MKVVHKVNGIIPKPQNSRTALKASLKQIKDTSFIRYLFFIAGSEPFNLLPQKVVEADRICRFSKG